MLLARDPTSTEQSNAVQLLNGFWGDACVYCGKDPPCGTCWVQDTRDQWLADTIVYSNEFYQVTGTVLLYGAHLGRAPSSTEISNLATQMVTSGFLQGGAIPVTASDEFFQDSATFEASYSVSFNRLNVSLPGNLRSSPALETYNGSVNYVRYLWRGGRLSPFATAGLGGDFNRFSVNVGTGMDTRLNRQLAFRLEFRDFIVPQPDPIRGVTHNPAPMAGIVLRFQ